MPDTSLYIVNPNIYLFIIQNKIRHKGKRIYLLETDPWKIFGVIREKHPRRTSIKQSSVKELFAKSTKSGNCFIYANGAGSDSVDRQS